MNNDIKNLSDYTSNFPEKAKGLEMVKLGDIEGLKVVITGVCDYSFRYNGEDKQSLIVIFHAPEDFEDKFTYVNNPYVISTLKKAESNGAFPCYATFDKVTTKSGHTCWVVN